MKGIFSVLVENKAGVLSKTAGLFARRGFNIDSLAVGETDDRDISSMTIISTGDERIMEQIEKQLNKKIDVIKVRRFAENKCVTRELFDAEGDLYECDKIGYYGDLQYYRCSYRRSFTEVHGH